MTQTPGGWWETLSGPWQACLEEAWREVLPEAVALGEDIYRSGWLAGRREAGAIAAAVFDDLAARQGEV